MAAWERFGAATHAMRLLTSQSLKHLHALPGNDSLFTLADDKLPDQNTVKQLQSISAALSLRSLCSGMKPFSHYVESSLQQGV